MDNSRLTEWMTMIDKLENGYAVGDPIIRGIVNKLNEVVDAVNRTTHEVTDLIAESESKDEKD